MSGQGLIILLVLIAGGVIWFSVARGRTRRGQAALARLAPVISGAVSPEDRRLRGTYRGHDVEAWATKYDPTPTSIPSDSTRVEEVSVFFVRIGGVAGQEPWGCRRQPRLNPFASPEYVFEWSYAGVGAPFAGLLGTIADLPEHDPGLEQRLPQADLLETIAGFGHRSSPYLPHVQYSPALHTRLPLPPDVLRHPHEQVGELLCEFEVERATDPSPEQFREALDRALHIAELNSKANPAPGLVDASQGNH